LLTLCWKSVDGGAIIELYACFWEPKWQESDVTLVALLPSLALAGGVIVGILYVLKNLNSGRK
jgi:hypothetical protein